MPYSCRAEVIISLLVVSWGCAPPLETTHISHHIAPVSQEQYIKSF